MGPVEEADSPVTTTWEYYANEVLRFWDKPHRRQRRSLERAKRQPRSRGAIGERCRHPDQRLPHLVHLWRGVYAHSRAVALWGPFGKRLSRRQRASHRPAPRPFPSAATTKIRRPPPADGKAGPVLARVTSTLREQSAYDIPNPANLTVPVPNPLLPDLFSDRRAKGWEFQATLEISNSLSLLGNYSKFTNRDPNDVPFRDTAEESYAVMLRYEFKENALKGLFFTVNLNYLGRRPGDAASGLTDASTSTKGHSGGANLLASLPHPLQCQRRLQLEEDLVHPNFRGQCFRHEIPRRQPQPLSRLPRGRHQSPRGRNLQVLGRSDSVEPASDVELAGLRWPPTCGRRRAMSQGGPPPPAARRATSIRPRGYLYGKTRRYACEAGPAPGPSPQSLVSNCRRQISLRHHAVVLPDSPARPKTR